MTNAFYEPSGDGFMPTELTRGPWDPDAQHASPPAALLGRALERLDRPERTQLGRITFEILRPVPLTQLSVTTRMVRPGRSVELVEASLADADGPVMLARSWWLRTGHVDVPISAEEPPPGPTAGEEMPFFATGQAVGYHTAMEYRFVSGAFLELGPAVVWVRMRHPLVAGEEPTRLQRVLAAADTGNGVSAVLDWKRFLFINTDLTVHLMRLPETDWVCLDAVTYPEPHGVGLADTALWDERGRIGRAAQTLLVRERTLAQ